MLKKQIQKLLSKILRPAFIGVAITAILAVNIGYIAASFISAQPTQAQVNCDSFDPTSPKTYASRIYVDKSSAPADRSYAIGAANVNGPDTQEIALNEELNVYAEVTLPATFTECATTANLDNAFKFEVYNAAGKIINGLRTNAKISKAGDQVKFYSEGMKNSDWNQYSVRGSSAPLPAYVYFCRATGCATTDVNGNDYIERFNIKINPTPATAAVVQPPSSALLSGTGSSSDPNAKKKAEDVTFRFRQDGAQGLRSKYRVLLDEKDPFNKLVFGSNGLEKIYVDWANDASKLTPSNQLVIPIKNSQIGADPYFKYVRVGLNYFDTKIENNGCKSTTFEEDCSGVIFTKKYESLNGKESVQQPTIPSGFDPVLYNAAWKSKVQDKTVGEGQPLGTVEFRVIPVIWAQSGVIIADWYSYVYASQAVKFTLEVYKTEADIKKACENDVAVTDKSICSDPQKMRYQVGEIVDVTTGTNQKSGSETQSLYDFIVRVISQIVIWLTALIYKIFAYFVVPVLNALLQVRPYQDAFVNIIYPGWLILRNLANIFFIISLLVVGLRILFQSSEASTSRGFIVRLILMALLVNFSLVIGQGVVGIADTVQSQFMPVSTDPVTGEKTNSKIIEALGNKLMVEPILSFRSAVSPDGSGSGQLTGDQTIADTAKPIVLLVLAIAAFFSFIAIAAFLAIRLVALMILYMVAPIAYASYVMKDTERFMSMWWSNFLKYAFLTPVLVFFLNIAALVATVFSGQNGNVIKLSDNLSGDLVAGGLTIATHFIVLMFIYAGMVVAQRSGTIGSKAIIDYSKKGFDALTKKPAKWAASAAPGAKDFVGDKASVGMGKLFGKRGENITQALFKPLSAAQKLKKGAWDRPGEDRKKREEKRLQTIDDQSYKIMNNKWKAAKYAASTLALNGPKRAFAAGGDLKDEASILTDDERRDAILNGATAAGDLAAAETEASLNERGRMSISHATDLRDKTDDDLTNLAAQRRSLIAKEADLRRKGDDAGADQKIKEIADVVAQSTQLTTAKRALDAAIAGGGTDFDLASLPVGSVNVVFKAEDYQEDLKKEIDQLSKEKERLDKQVSEDDRRRAEHGYDRWTGAGSRQMILTERQRLNQEGESIQNEATKRFLPLTYADREQRRAAERDEEKKIEDVDDADELIEGFNTAMKKNNVALATAIAKKMAKEGTFDQLLASQGNENNVKSFQAFLDKNLGKLAPQVRFQVGSEISHIAGQNGNTAIAKSTKVDKGVSRWSHQDEHAKFVNPKLEGAAPAKLAELGKNELTYQAQGKYHLHRGVSKNLNNMDQKQLEEFSKRLAPAKIKHILNTSNIDGVKQNVVDFLKRKIS